MEGKNVVPKMCPFLTLGRLQVQTTLETLNPQPAGVIGAEIKVGFVPCQREKCGVWAEKAERCSLSALGNEAGDNGERLGNLAAELSALIDRLDEFEKTARKQAAAFETIAQGYAQKSAG